MNSNHSQYKILVVDDNPKNIQVVGTILKEAGYDVGFAMDGSQAVKTLDDFPDYDLVLMDIKMPVMDGFEACRRIRRNDRLKELPVIFLSVSHDTENISMALEIGGVDYITKPFKPKELLSRVNTHIQLRYKTKELMKNALELEKLNRTKDKLFTIIAHDLRNPFEGIKLVCDILADNITSLTTEEIGRHIGLIHSATENGYMLLQNLLLWSKSQTGNIAYNPVMTDLDKTIRRVLEEIRPSAVMKGIVVKYPVRPEKLMISTDDFMTSHVLRNILTNAVKFTKSPGRVSVHIRQEPGIVRVTISDTGIGISQAESERLFKSDQQLPERRGTAREVGSGLGLILCKEFMDKMGGNITVSAKPGKGSRFIIDLPVN